MKLLSVGAALAVLSFAAPALAQNLQNGGFETGASAPWVAVGDVQVVSSATDLNQLVIFAAPEGQFFARLTAGDVPDVYTTLSQSFTIDEASTLSFSANFVAYDGFGYNDDAYVRIFSLASESYVFRSDVDTVGEYAWTDWRAFSLGLTASGAYTFEAGVRNVGEFGVAEGEVLERLDGYVRRFDVPMEDRLPTPSRRSVRV